MCSMCLCGKKNIKLKKLHMLPIKPPVHNDSNKALIANLHEILTFLGMPPAAAEVKVQAYSDSTKKIVTTFQKDNQLRETDGFVGDITAARLNELVAQQNGFEAEY